MLQYDYHTHTAYSHGKGSPEENVLAAIAAGLEAVAISEHGPGHLFYGVRGEALRRLRREVDALNAKYSGQIRVLMGLECNLTGFGLTDLPAGEESMFDIKLMAFHKGARPADKFGLIRALEPFGLARPEPVATANALLAAAEKYRIDILSHPGLYVRCCIPTLAKGAAELGIMLEINAARVTMSPEELRQAAEAGAELIIGSDAHRPERVGDCALALAAAEAAGVTGSVVNLK